MRFTKLHEGELPEQKPIILQGEVVKGAMMYLSLTFDHRVVDGAPAAEFLQKLKGYLEDPWWMVA